MKYLRMKCVIITIKLVKALLLFFYLQALSH